MATDPTTGAPVPTSSSSSAISDVLNKVPTTTLFFIALNVGVYLWGSLTSVNVGEFAIGAYTVVYMNQWYRIVTSAFFHGSLMHIGMNMMSFYALGSSLERYLGSAKFFFLLWLFVLLGGFLYVALCMGMAYGFARDFSWLVYNSVGFSGVIFSLAVLESSYSPAPTRSVFGFVSVPTKYYPWVLLVLLSVMMPNISFVGHLSGLLVGFVHFRGFFNLLVPSDSFFKSVDASSAVSSLRKFQGYVPQQQQIDVDSEVAAAIASAIELSRGGGSSNV